MVQLEHNELMLSCHMDNNLLECISSKIFMRKFHKSLTELNYISTTQFYYRFYWEPVSQQIISLLPASSKRRIKKTNRYGSEPVYEITEYQSLSTRDRDLLNLNLTSPILSTPLILNHFEEEILDLDSKISSSDSDSEIEEVDVEINEDLLIDFNEEMKVTNNQNNDNNIHIETLDESSPKKTKISGHPP